jgi:hypothetical protein
VAACNHSLKHQRAVAAPAANQQQKRPRWLHPSRTPRKMYADVAKPPAPLILLFYQVEIRLLQFLHRNSSIHSQLPTRRDSTTRLWQLQGCYVEIAGLPAALGMTTLYSMRAYRPLSSLSGPSVWRMKSSLLPRRNFQIGSLYPICGITLFRHFCVHTPVEQRSKRHSHSYRARISLPASRRTSAPMLSSCGAEAE